MLSRILAAFGALLIAGLPVRGAAQSSVQGRLDILNQEISTTGAQIAATTTKQQELEGKLKELRASLAAIKSQRVSLTARAADLERDVTRLQAGIEQLEQRLIKLRAIALSRVRALYREQRMGGQLTILSGVQHGDLARLLVYAERMQGFDQRLTARFATEKVELHKRHEAMEIAQREQAVTQSQLAASERALIQQTEDQKKVLNALATERSQLESSLVELRAQVLRLETVLLSLTGGSGSEYDAPTAPQSEPAAGAVGYQSYQGRGLFARGARLSLPVRGKVVRRYGKYKPSKLSDVVMNKGVELLAPADAEVVAVASGRVLYAGRMPVYGLVVVLDHGDRSYSLYGRLKGTPYAQGADIERGEELGTLGALETGEQGNFYFEIRRAGEAVNPSKLLRELG